MKKLLIAFILTLPALLIFSCSGSGNKENAEEGTADSTENQEMSSARVYFVSPLDGDSLSSPVVIQMGIDGMEIEPAGEVKEGMGHHHLIINGSYIENGVVVPTDSTHVHYGKGQTSDTLNLRPGNYSLTLQFADGFHQSYGEPLSSTIHITVVDNN
jgi:hypothetical protein